MKRAYFDYAATTPLRQEVLEGMMTYLQKEYGNPSSIHDIGQHARDAVEIARKQVADAIGATPREIIFTAGGTESNNLAILGAARQWRKKGNHLITSQVEHPSVLDTCRFLKNEGFEVTYLPVDETGQVDVETLLDSIRSDTILVSIMAANNEVGTLMPISEIAKHLRKKKIFFHSDTIQYIGKVPFHVEELGVDALSIGGHKIYGPKGIGALYLRKGSRIAPTLFGGGQERGLRPGTHNVAAIVGLGIAVKEAARNAEKEKERLFHLRELLWKRIQKEIGQVRLNGHETERLPNTLNLSFHRIEGQAILLELNRYGISVSSGSACSAGKHAPSHVLMAMGRNEEDAHQSVRITLGKDTTEEDIHLLVERLKEVLTYLRSLISI